MAGQAMTASALIARAEAAGVRMRLGEDGALELEAARPPSPALLAALRARRDEVRAALLAAAHSELPPAWLAAMRRRAEAGRARIERHNCTDVAVFEPLAGEPDDAPGLIASALPAAIGIAEAAAERAAPSGPGAGYRPGDADPLAEGLLVGALDAPRLRRLATFQRAPVIHVTGWRVAAAVRANGVEVRLGPDDKIIPTGLGAVPEALREHARANAEPLRAWLALERAAGARAPSARPPFGTRPSPLVEGRDFCAVCGPPVPGTVAVWWCLPGTGWRCAECCEPPHPAEDDRAVFAAGRSGGLPPDDLDPAPAALRAAPDGLTPRADGD